MATHPYLDEGKVILPFFKERPNLSLMVGYYFPHIRSLNVVAPEYPIYGDFRADLLVGDKISHQYLIVEFENGGPDSIFKRKGQKATLDWSPRFEAAFSQLVDWTWKLDDMRSTSDFQDVFGGRKARFHTLMIIGKNMSLSDQEKTRLEWRIEHVLLNNNKVQCISFDELLESVNFRLRTFHGA